MAHALAKATLALVGLTVLPNPAYSDPSSPAFSYCSDGVCRTITSQFFHAARGMPLDLRFACRPSDKAYALTFDDGPTANYPALLEILERHAIKASFLVVGRQLEKPEAQSWLKMAHAAGHFIGNHTYTHVDLTQLTADEILTQVDQTRRIILEVLGSSPALEASTRIVRPPFGNIDETVQNALTQAGYVSIRWNADRYDWQHGDRQKVLERVVEQLAYIEAQKARGVNFNHSILDLNHDGQAATLAAIDLAIPLIKAQGYEFLRLDECL